MALVNLLLSPFLLAFLLIYFFLRNAEKFYHHPSTIGARRWSSLAKWRLREFNELPHYINHRSVVAWVWILSPTGGWSLVKLVRVAGFAPVARILMLK